MTRTGRVGHALRIVLTALVLGMGLLATTLTVAIPAAEAHAELREASPGVGQTVGGEFHRIAMHFTGLDATQPQAMQLFDPAGNLIDEGGAAEGQRLVLSISPLTLPGEYTVNYQVNGIDGDYVEESYTFRYEPSADEPSELTIGNPIDSSRRYEIIVPPRRASTRAIRPSGPTKTNRTFSPMSTAPKSRPTGT